MPLPGNQTTYTQKLLPLPPLLQFSDSLGVIRFCSACSGYCFIVRTCFRNALGLGIDGWRTGEPEGK